MRAVQPLQVLPNDLRAQGIDKTSRGIAPIPVDRFYLDTNAAVLAAKLDVSPIVGVDDFLSMDAEAAVLGVEEACRQPELQMLFRDAFPKEDSVTERSLLDALTDFLQPAEHLLKQLAFAPWLRQEGSTECLQRNLLDQR